MSDDFIKLAAEYDSAGRIMARGFFDELTKMATYGPGGMMPGGGMMGTGKGAKFGGKKAPTFTSDTKKGIGNPTENPERFGTGTGDNVQKTDRAGASEAAPGKRPKPPKGAGDGPGPGAPSTHMLMGE